MSSKFTFKQDAERARMYLEHIIEMEDEKVVERYLPKMQLYLNDCVTRIVNNKLSRKDIQNVLDYFDLEKENKDVI